LQTLLRNPLASPDILGVSSGASLGVMTSIWLTAGGVVGTLAGAAWHAGPALLGAVGALAMVLTLSRRAGSLDPAGLVIIGVVVSVLCGAAVMFLQYLMPDAGFATARLLMGGLSDDTPSIVLVLVAVATLAGIVIAWLKGPTLDALVIGPDEAESVGVHVARARWVLLGITGTLSAGAVVIAGPIGFVGLIAPHAARLLLRVPHSNHRWQLPASAAPTVAPQARRLARSCQMIRSSGHPPDAAHPHPAVPLTSSLAAQSSKVARARIDKMTTGRRTADASPAGHRRGRALPTPGQGTYPKTIPGGSLG
ncbi:MAG: FecCD family ABC transporter permease, partial [bacterium]